MNNTNFAEEIIKATELLPMRRKEDVKLSINVLGNGRVGISMTYGNMKDVSVYYPCDSLSVSEEALNVVEMVRDKQLI